MHGSHCARHDIRLDSRQCCRVPTECALHAPHPDRTGVIGWQLINEKADCMRSATLFVYQQHGSGAVHDMLMAARPCIQTPKRQLSLLFCPPPDRCHVCLLDVTPTMYSIPTEQGPRSSSSLMYMPGRCFQTRRKTNRAGCQTTCKTPETSPCLGWHSVHPFLEASCTHPCTFHYHGPADRSGTKRSATGPSCPPPLPVSRGLSAACRSCALSIPHSRGPRTPPPPPAA